ncbi:MAG: hypothetical protein AAF251_15850 [Pseudomonadota bacterium]
MLTFGAIVWLLTRTRRYKEADDESEFTGGARREMGAAFDIGGQERSVTKTAERARPAGFQMDTLKAALKEEPKPSASAPSGATLASPRPKRVASADSFAHRPNKGPPLPLAMSLSITSARRSVMMFTIEYRVDLANRGDTATRDLIVTGDLGCAQAGHSSDRSSAPAPLLGQIERIGPHQSRAVTGILEMPLADVRLIRQGATSMFIPLMTVNVKSEGWSDLLARFVIGTPSPASASRLQPIIFDTRIGGLGALRADKVQSFAAPAPSSNPAESSAV